MPIFPEILVASNPGWPRSTTRKLKRLDRFSALGSVMAMTSTWSATVPLDMNCLEPFKRYPVSVGAAVEAWPKMSLPALASVMAVPQIFSPPAMPGR